MVLAAAPLRVLFFLQRAEAWGNVESVWRVMVASPAFNPTAWLLPCDVSDARRSAVHSTQHRMLLAEAGVAFIEWDASVLLAPGQFDVVVFTHPYDRERPAALWFDRVRACVPRVVYVPYGLSVGAGTKNLRLQFAQALQQGADLIVARSDAERAMYERYCPAGDSHVRVLGHPRFDRLQAELRTAREGALEQRIGGRIAFLWNAHFSFVERCRYSANFSTFDLLGAEILSFFASNANRLCLVWRPHPAFLRALDEQGLVAAERIPALRSELEAIGIVLDESADHLPAFRACHALLSDPGSFWFEYLAVGKPMLPLLNPRGEPVNAEAMQLLGALGSGSTVSDVLQFVRMVVSGNRSGEEEMRACALHLPGLDGRAGERICKVISGQSGVMPATKSGELAAYGRAHTLNAYTGDLDWSCDAPVALGPVLRDMLERLARLRSERQAQGELQYRVMRACGRVRSILVEWVKRSPRLMRLISRSSADQ